MAVYLTIPLFFSLLIYTLVYLAVEPVVNAGVAVASMVIARETPNFLEDLSTIYQDKNLIERSSIPLSEVVIPYIGTHYANLSIERLGVTTPVYFGDSDRILLAGAGQYSGSFLPGFKRPILLSGHNMSVFNYLQYLTVGDKISLKTNYGLYIYEVTAIAIHSATDPTAIDLGKQEEELILYTCYPFQRLSSRKYDRWFVYAKRISGPDVK